MSDDISLLKSLISLLKQTKDMLVGLPVPVLAGISSGILALLRISYVQKKVRFVRRLVEGTICSLLTISVSYFFISLGLPELMSYGIGSYIGWYGADETARIAKQKVQAFLNEEKKDD